MGVGKTLIVLLSSTKRIKGRSNKPLTIKIYLTFFDPTLQLGNKIVKEEYTRKMDFDYKNILKESILGQLFILGTAPIDKPKIDLSPLNKKSKITDSWFTYNLIIGHRP